ncbi:MAG: succinate dehydrogenase cytochrome b subunit [Longimicrobiales bacterium]|nr:succinate dehydrogenase cytochrome b subunit [Longimicrobiales bacterium]
MPDIENVRVRRTSIGRKLAMATASILLFLYVVAHLAGNLKVFLGAESFNHYAEWLRVVGEPLFPEKSVLWIARVVLLAALFVHIGAYVQLWLQKRRARTTRYKKYDPQVFSWMSRAMAWGGIAIFAFVTYHLLHLTFGTAHPDFIAGDAYHNVIAGFQSIPVAGVYAVGVIALGMHLYHGLWSALQTFGINNPKYNRYRRPAAAIIAVLITIGYLSIPLAVLTGVIR